MPRVKQRARERTAAGERSYQRARLGPRCTPNACVYVCADERKTKVEAGRRMSGSLPSGAQLLPRHHDHSHSLMTTLSLSLYTYSDRVSEAVVLRSACCPARCSLWPHARRRRAPSQLDDSHLLHFNSARWLLPLHKQGQSRRPSAKRSVSSGKAEPSEPSVLLSRIPRTDPLERQPTAHGSPRAVSPRNLERLGRTPAPRADASRRRRVRRDALFRPRRQRQVPGPRAFRSHLIP